MKTLLSRILCSAAQSMWQKDPTLGHYTSDTMQHELNLSFHYAAELRNWFPWLHCDVDVAKRGGNRERPDIILHRRGNHHYNFLVIEAKREKSRGAVGEDLAQIRERWLEMYLRYRYGAAVILEDDTPKFEVQILSRQDKDSNPVVLKHTNMGAPLLVPNTDKPKCAQLLKQVEQSLSSQDVSMGAAPKISGAEMDQLLCAFYGVNEPIAEGDAK